MTTAMQEGSQQLVEQSNNAFHLQLQITHTLPTTSEQDTSVEQDYELICWGCGLRLILPSNAPVLKCGWCGAITKQSEGRHEGKNLRRILIRDRCFVSILLIFMTFVICGGVWAVYPVVFSVSYFCGVFHCIVTLVLSLSTITMFCLAAFSDAGTPTPVVWGSYPAIRKDELQDYTFCQYCSKPKSPRTHHCSSCRTCVLGMDHHCPFIGNCVGASNHRYFISFLTIAVTSVTYAAIMFAYGILHLLPSLGEGARMQLHGVMGLLKEIFVAFVTSAVFFSSRGLVLLYLFVASTSLGIGLLVLLWQQLYFIYEGRTYLDSLNSQVEAKRDCKNLYQFFGLPHDWPRLLLGYCCNTKKIHRK